MKRVRRACVTAWVSCLLLLGLLPSCDLNPRPEDPSASRAGGDPGAGGSSDRPMRPDPQDFGGSPVFEGPAAAADGGIASDSGVPADKEVDEQVQVDGGPRSDAADAADAASDAALRVDGDAGDAASDALRPEVRIP